MPYGLRLGVYLPAILLCSETPLYCSAGIRVRAGVFDAGGMAGALPQKQPPRPQPPSRRGMRSRLEPQRRQVGAICNSFHNLVGSLACRSACGIAMKQWLFIFWPTSKRPATGSEQQEKAFNEGIRIFDCIGVCNAAMLCCGTLG